MPSTNRMLSLRQAVENSSVPLHKFASWWKVKSRWGDLPAGEYEWSSISKRLRQKETI